MRWIFLGLFMMVIGFLAAQWWSMQYPLHEQKPVFVISEVNEKEHVIYDPVTKTYHDQWNQPLWSDGVIIPPAEFMKRYPNHVVIYKTFDELQKICGKLSIACTWKPDPPFRDYCLTILEHHYPQDQDPSHVWVHEQAHCWGWNHQNS